MKIIEIEGVGDKYAKDLEKAGIADVEDLVPITWSGLKELAESTKISLKLLEKWQDIAELMKIDGVGPEYSQVLNLVGIDSTKELAYRSPENTLEKIVAHDKDQPDTIRNLPELKQITGWIDEAKKMYDVHKEKSAPKGTPIIEIVHPDDVEKCLKGIQRGIEQGEAGEELRIIDKNGAYHWFEFKGRWFTDKEGLRKGFIVGRKISRRSHQN